MGRKQGGVIVALRVRENIVAFLRRGTRSHGRGADAEATRTASSLFGCSVSPLDPVAKLQLLTVAAQDGEDMETAQSKSTGWLRPSAAMHLKSSRPKQRTGWDMSRSYQR